MKIYSVILLSILCTGCFPYNVNDLKESAKHQVYYTKGTLQDIYTTIIKKYNECGIVVSNTFINNKNGIAGASIVNIEYNWWIAHMDIKEEKKDEVRVDVYRKYSGMYDRFNKVTLYAIEKKLGCP